MNLLFLIIGLFLGTGLTFGILFFLAKKNERKVKQDNIKMYQQILNKLSSNEVIFNSRVNNTVQLNVEVEPEGEIQIMYFLDRQDISIFQEGDCLYTSTLIGKDLIEKIMKTIWSKFSFQINDVVQLQSNTFDRRTFMIISGMNNTQTSTNVDGVEEIEYNLDDILDKINEVGYNNLSESEKQFLKNLNK